MHMNIRRNVTLQAVLLAGFLVAGLAHGADSAPGKSGEGPAQKAGRTTPASTPIGINAPQLAGMSQQNKMKECNRLAKGQKGAERKSFMKNCLSKKKA
jgi:hypothetical protein